jgi:hypothetical protein
VISFPTTGNKRIVINESHTGDELRTWIRNHPNNTYYRVQGRDIYLNCRLKVKGSGSFTDHNASYNFLNNSIFSPSNNKHINFTDVVLNFSQSPKGAAINPFVANFTRVNIIQSVATGRSDLFSSNNSTLNFNDVRIVLNGTSDSLYIKSEATINDLIISSTKNHELFVGPDNASQIQTIDNFQLNNISSIVGQPESQGDVILKKLNWNNVDWKFRTNNVDIKIVDPIKPAGWTGYSGNCYRVKEYSTHKLKALDHTRNPIANAHVKLWNNNEASFDYETTTNASGEIPQQEILKIQNSPTVNHDRGPWKLFVCDYSKEYFNRARSFDKSVNEEIIILPDRAVTETSKATVNAYTSIENCDKLYDRSKLWKVNNINLLQPSLEELLITRQGKELHLATGWDLEIDKNLPTAFQVVGTTLKIKSIKLLPTNKYEKLIVDQEITFVNDEEIDFPYSDINHDSYVRFVDLKANDTITVMDMDDNVLEVKRGECGYSYMSTLGKKIKVQLNRANGESSLMHYSLENRGIDNFLRMGISEIYMETMFNRSDRDKLLNSVKRIVEQLEKDDSDLDQILDWVRYLIHQVKPNPKKY